MATGRGTWRCPRAAASTNEAVRDPPAVNDARSPTAARLLSAGAIREHCGEIATWVEAGHSPHFAWHAERLPAAAAYVAQVIRERYPELGC